MKIYVNKFFKKNTCYAAVLAESGLMKISHMLNRARICYLNQILWEMDDCEVKSLILADWAERREKSHVETIKRIAEGYGLPDLTTSQLDSELTKMRIREVNDDELLREVWMSKAAEKRTWLRLRLKPHFKWPKMLARARVLDSAGGLRFMAQASGWKSFYRARQLSVMCVSRMCSEEDTLYHAKRCKFMYT